MGTPPIAESFVDQYFYDDLSRIYRLSTSNPSPCHSPVDRISVHVSTRIAYGIMRWKRVPAFEDGDPLCLACRFNIKGNTSGICPECGTPVTIM
ncbi:MAG: hypothetical protein IPK83_01740 [Planctomycetes bacterium]|nr:hypothetical protein [Planctomycetota bacterium]